MGDLVIPLHDLDSQGKDFSFALGQAWLERAFAGTGVTGDAARGGGQVAVHAQRNGREILVHGHAKACLVAECVRCLQGLPLDVEADVATLYAPADAGTAQKAHHAHARGEEDDIEIDPDAPERETYSGDTLEIDALVRDSLLLELPMQPRCELGWACPNLDLPEHLRSPEGVSTKGFDEGKVDPRLAPLMKLAKKGEHDKE
jgi:uncharacterized metal-binding protein YceD (DUF177 family)